MPPPGEMLPDMSEFPTNSLAGSCGDCGRPFELDSRGVSFHINEDGSCDFGSDRDHVAYG
ncbi:hypothetical protein BKG60_04760 [Mycobacterium syngnathidarum]|uniref:Uncharacterized protein n=2 Tax=Mycobacteriaceae TaxID=1762 RepID=A0A1Q9WFY5_9MYCO|nr:hypothetical protein [Mycolicibacterium lutetiense]OHT88327.1 hypothetical protein BKG61_27690 [Mycobacterium syngnathidarum]OLT97684.1 hypothetical protein BKG60_04760 [Mycobacterium syngnathidarum]